MEKKKHYFTETFYKKQDQRVNKKHHRSIKPIDYFYPQIVLTKVDQVEEKIRNSLASTNLDPYELERRLREAIDMKIEEIVIKLGVPRDSVHFIENYHEKSSQVILTNFRNKSRCGR